MHVDIIFLVKVCFDIKFRTGRKEQNWKKRSSVFNLSATTAESVGWNFAFETLSLIRCSILEPGPVDTQVIQNMEVWTKKYEKTTVDQKSLKLHEEFMGKMMQELPRTSQSGNEIADIVKSIILSPEPSLRYPTNKKFFVDLIEAKLAEIPGDRLVKLIDTNYLAKE